MGKTATYPHFIIWEDELVHDMISVYCEYLELRGFCQGNFKLSGASFKI